MVVFPYADLGFSGGPEVVQKLAELIRQCRPDVVLSHWPGSFHEGHVHAATCTLQAVVHAADARRQSALPPHRVQAVYCPENWEDPFNFVPEFYVDVSDVMEVWERSCKAHELFRGGASSFRYLDYYRGAMAAHGAVARCAHAVAIATPPTFAPRLVNHLPGRKEKA